MEQPRICVYTCNHQREAVMAGKQAIEFPIFGSRDARAIFKFGRNKIFFHLVFWLAPKEKKELTYMSRSRGFFYQYLSGISSTFV